MVTKKQALDAAARLHMADLKDANGKELFIAAGGGYGDKARNALLADIRTLIDSQLEGAPASPFGDAA